MTKAKQAPKVEDSTAVVEDSVVETRPVAEPVTTTELPNGLKIEDY